MVDLVLLVAEVVLVEVVEVVVEVAGNRADFLKEVVATEGMEVVEEVSTRVAA